MTDSNVTVEVDDYGVASLTLSRPSARNALSSLFVRQIADAATKLVGNAGVRVIVLRSADPEFFSVGADLPTKKDSPARTIGGLSKY